MADRDTERCLQNGQGPSVTVLITVHNGLPYLESALRSVMGQSLRDIEIIVVDDASTDGTPDLLKTLAAEDTRLRVLRLDDNLGAYGAANRGLEMARGDYIARMDADDLSEPERLEVQKAHLEAHPEQVLVGSSVQRITADGRLRQVELRALDPFQVRWQARLNMPLFHPTYMFRRLAADGTALRYRTDRIAQDYAFCVDALAHGDVASLAPPLVRYREHDGSMTLTRRKAQDAAGRGIAEAFQAGDLPPDLCRAMIPVMDAIYELDKPIDAFGIFRGMRRLIAHTRVSRPDQIEWMRQHTGVLFRYVFTLRTPSPKRMWLSFALNGPDFIAPYLRHLKTYEQARRDVAVPELENAL